MSVKYEYGVNESHKTVSVIIPLENDHPQSFQMRLRVLVKLELIHYGN